MAGVGRTPRSTEVAEDVRDFQSRTGHARRQLCRRLVPVRSQRSEAIQWARDCADRVGDHLRVERGGLELGMPEQDLDQANVGVLLQQLGGKAVPQRVASPAS